MHAKKILLVLMLIAMQSSAHAMYSKAQIRQAPRHERIAILRANVSVCKKLMICGFVSEVSILVKNILDSKNFVVDETFQEQTNSFAVWNSIACIILLFWFDLENFRDNDIMLDAVLWAFDDEEVIADLLD